MVVTHADRCADRGYVPGMVDGWRPVLRETLHADGSIKVCLLFGDLALWRRWPAPAIIPPL